MLSSIELDIMQVFAAIISGFEAMQLDSLKHTPACTICYDMQLGRLSCKAVGPWPYRYVLLPRFCAERVRKTTSMFKVQTLENVLIVDRKPACRRLQSDEFPRNLERHIFLGSPKL